MFRISRLFCTILIMLTVGLLQADLWAFSNEPRGFKGYEWGADLSKETEIFKKWGRSGSRKASYKYRPMSLEDLVVYFSASGKTVEGKFYSADTFDNQFMSATIRFSCEDVALWETVFSKLYGKPKIVGHKSGMRVFTWKGQTVLISATTKPPNKCKVFPVKFYNINLKDKYMTAMKKKKDEQRKERNKKKQETGGF